MKKIFTLICTLMGLASVANAADIDDVRLCKHSYVLVCDEYTNNGTGKRDKGTLFGDNFFLDVKGGSVSNSKKKSDPAEKITDAEGVETYRYGEEFAKKYGEYGAHFNSLRLKNDQDMIALKITAGSKLIFLLEGNNKTGKDARYPKISKNADLSNPLNAAPDASFEGSTNAGFKYEWSCDEDMTAYIGSYNGDMFLSYVIVEANEAPGTPTVKVGPQTFSDGLWFREVTCKTNDADLLGDGSMILPTICTYTTDGTEPTDKSPVYTTPIKCFEDQTVKFQAFFKEEGGIGDICENADNEGIVSFSFNAPTISVAGANVTVTSEYEGAKNYISYLEEKDVEASTATLEESAVLTAYSKIVNGEYATFTTKSTSKDVYVLNPIKEKKTISVVAGKAVLDEVATATSTTGPVYTIEDGKISTDKMDFFVKNLTFGALPNSDSNLAKYQAPANTEGYIKMSDTNISFLVAAGDSVDVTVVCSKNSCKNIDIAPLTKESTAKDTTNYYAALMCMVNVSGTNYGDTIFVGDKEDLDSYRNVIKFGLKAGEADQIFTFQKYSGTGNILVSSIEIAPVKEEVVSDPHDLCLKVTNPEIKAESYGTQLFYSLKERLVTGTDYVMTMDVKFEKEQKEGLGFWPYFNPLDADAKTQYTGFGGEPYAANEWITLTCNFNAQADHMFLQFPLGHIDGTMYIDNVCLVAKGSEINLVENGTFDEAVELVTFSDYGKEANVELGKWWTWSWAAPTVEYAGIEEITFVTKSSNAQKMIIDGKLVIKTAKGTFNAAGIQVK